MKATPFLREGVLYGTLVAVLLLLVGADLAIFKTMSRSGSTIEGAASVSQTGAPVGAGANECTYDTGKAVVENFDALVDASDPAYGNLEAPVTLLEFFDPNCPHCKHLHPVIKEVLAANGDHLRVVYKPIALPQFEMSVVQNAALFAAAEEGKFTEMLDLQFEGQKRGGIAPKELKQLARKLGMDGDVMEQRIRDGAFDDTLNKRHQQAAAVGLTGVPAVILNGRFVASRSRTVACLTELIEQELQTVNAGG